MRRQKSLIASLLILALSFGALAQRQQSAMSPISINTLRAHIKFLSDDQLEGRGTGAPGGELAAKYIAAQLEALGLKGAGENGSYFQPVSLVGVKADPSTVLTVSSGDKRETFKFADDYVAFTGAQAAEVEANAELVFVGYGIDAPEFGTHGGGQIVSITGATNVNAFYMRINYLTPRSTHSYASSPSEIPADHTGFYRTPRRTTRTPTPCGPPNL